MSKKYYLSFLFFTLYFIGTSQNYIPSYTEKTISNFLDLQESQLKDDEFNILFHNEYGASEIINFDDSLKMGLGVIKEVRLYYSDYPKGGNFTSLNQSRINHLLENIPQLNDSKIEWSMIKQTAGIDKNAAIKLFHGFEIICQFTEQVELSKLELDSQFQDFVVEKVLSRNNWTEMLIVTDVTGSMSPYIQQLFMWLQLNTIDDKIKQFIFFNDGDFTVDTQKEIGKTGGIYHTQSKNYKRVENVALQCMMSGNGGDLPENDLEATLKGMKLCPDCKEHILIADNYSNMRDLELLKNINKPVRVIICGAMGEINPEYLNVARSTGGSIHLMEEDLLFLMEVNEGESVEIQGITYRIEDNQFVKVKRM